MKESIGATLSATMARITGDVLHKHVYAVMRAIGDVVPRLDNEARSDPFGVLHQSCNTYKNETRSAQR
jgi:hypothetical protein